MKPLTCQFATGYSLYYLPRSASVTELSLKLHIKAHGDNISVPTAYLQLEIWKLITHLEYMHFIHYTYFHTVATLNPALLSGYISRDLLYFVSKICFLTSGLICLKYFMFLSYHLVIAQLFVYSSWQKSCKTRKGCSGKTYSSVFFFLDGNW